MKYSNDTYLVTLSHHVKTLVECLSGVVSTDLMATLVFLSESEVNPVNPTNTGP